MSARAPLADSAAPRGDDAVALTRTVKSARPSDADRGIVRLDPADMTALGVAPGDVVALGAARTTHARAMPALERDRGANAAHLDAAQRDNAGVNLEDAVTITPAAAAAAEMVTLRLDTRRFGARGASAALLTQIRDCLESLPVGEGDRVRLRLLGGRALSAIVETVRPAGPALITAETEIALARPNPPRASAASPVGRAIAYEDLGGLGRELARVREMIELPLRRPDLFAHLGVEAPKGVLLTGPPGTGKTLLARAVAAETQAGFFQINGPEIVTKHYGDSEAQLRAVFKKAQDAAPAIVFIDEIDAIAPARDQLAGDRQVERRVVAQLLTLLDGMDPRGQVIVMAATNLPDSLDPALRRPGRFDREIPFSAPDRAGRREILDVHTRGMPLAEDVDLDAVAAGAHGFVGADLAALAREAAMAALRRADALDVGRAAAVTPDDLQVTAGDFDAARREVGPSAIREVFTELPDVSWADVGGLEEAKAALTEAVLWPLAHAEAFARLALPPTKGVLLYGPPGAGKTHIAKALAAEARVNFITVRGPQLLGRYVGEAEANVRRVFAKARQTAPCILFFDEIDALAPARGAGVGGDGVVERVVAQLLTEIDGVDELKGVFLLAATNRVWAVDQALLRPGRFDLLLETPAPDVDARRQILDVHTKETPLAADVDLTALAQNAEGLLGADLKALCQAAGRAALRRAVAAGSPDASALAVSAADFATALATRAASDHARALVPRPDQTAAASAEGTPR